MMTPGGAVNPAGQVMTPGGAIPAAPKKLTPAEELAAKRKAFEEANKKRIEEARRLMAAQNGMGGFTAGGSVSGGAVTPNANNGAAAAPQNEAARRMEAARRAEEARRAEAARRLEEARKAAALKREQQAKRINPLEEARKTEEAKIAEEARKMEEAKKAVFAKLLENNPAKKAALEKKAADAKAAEEAKKAAEAKKAEEAAAAKNAEEEKRRQEAIRVAAEQAAKAALEARRREEEIQREAAKRAAEMQKQAEEARRREEEIQREAERRIEQFKQQQLQADQERKVNELVEKRLAQFQAGSGNGGITEAQRNQILQEGIKLGQNSVQSDAIARQLQETLKNIKINPVNVTYQMNMPAPGQPADPNAQAGQPGQAAPGQAAPGQPGQAPYAPYGYGMQTPYGMNGYGMQTPYGMNGYGQAAPGDMNAQNLQLLQQGMALERENSMKAELKRRQEQEEREKQHQREKIELEKRLEEERIRHAREEEKLALSNGGNSFETKPQESQIVREEEPVDEKKAYLEQLRKRRLERMKKKGGNANSEDAKKIEEELKKINEKESKAEKAKSANKNIEHVDSDKSIKVFGDVKITKSPQFIAPFKDLYWAADPEIQKLEKNALKKVNNPNLSIMLINESIFYYSGSSNNTASLEITADDEKYTLSFGDHYMIDEKDVLYSTDCDILRSICYKIFGDAESVYQFLKKQESEKFMTLGETYESSEATVTYSANTDGKRTFLIRPKEEKKQ